MKHFTHPEFSFTDRHRNTLPTYIISFTILKKASALGRPRGGWYGEGGERGVQDGEHMYICGGFILIFGKTNTIL